MIHEIKPDNVKSFICDCIDLYQNLSRNYKNNFKISFTFDPDFGYNTSCILDYTNIDEKEINLICNFLKEKNYSLFIRDNKINIGAKLSNN